MRMEKPAGTGKGATRRIMSSILALCVVIVLGLGIAACAGTGEAAPVSTTSGVASSGEKVGAAGYTTTDSDDDSVTADSAESSDTAESDASGTLEQAAMAGSEGSEEYTATDTSYESATKSVAVSSVTAGSGSGTVTYYVADVQLSEGADLLSAFSSSEYGGQVQDTSDIAAASEAIVAVNGDYYGARDDGIIIRNGVLYRDVPARTGLALYKDGSMETYDETETSAEELLEAGVWNTYSFGPALLEDGSIVEGIDSYEAETNPRHPIRGTNPRTGIGMISAGHFVLVVVDGRSPGYSRGVTLTEFAQIFQELGCSTAYNLDGGGSATLYFMGDLVNQPSQKRGERSVSDILYVG
jgi:exopolysaccharide biosynthesis protein